MKKNSQVLKKMMYRIKDNGTNPFFVSVENNNIEVFENPLKGFISTPFHQFAVPTSHINLENPVKIFKSKKVFIGEIPKKHYTSESILDKILGRKKKAVYHSEEYVKKFSGNTILLKISKKKYVFIERCVYQFSVVNDEIIDYSSWIGPNDVPYPVAYGKKYIYFLFEGGKNSRLLRNKVPEKYLIKENVIDLVGFFYRLEDLIKEYVFDIEDWKILVKGNLYSQMVG